jgi:hypothetical protein
MGFVPGEGEPTDGQTMQADSGPSGGQTTALTSGSNTQMASGPLKSFHLFPKLPSELRQIILVQATGNEINIQAPRIIEVRLDQRSFANFGIANPDFRMLSPPGPYQAPDWNFRLINQESNRVWTARFPNRLDLTGWPTIFFKASQDIIYLDARSLFVLHEIDEFFQAPGMSVPPVIPQVPAGFTAIVNLATPLDDNNIIGMTADNELLGLPRRNTGQLRSVSMTAITLLKNVPTAIEDDQGVLNYYLFRFNAQQVGNFNAYSNTRAAVRVFFEINDYFQSDDDMGDEG